MTSKNSSGDATLHTPLHHWPQPHQNISTGRYILVASSVIRYEDPASSSLHVMGDTSSHRWLDRRTGRWNRSHHYAKRSPSVFLLVSRFLFLFNYHFVVFICYRSQYNFIAFSKVVALSPWRKIWFQIHLMAYGSLLTSLTLSLNSTSL